jgi:hypothetical protein
MFMDHPYRLADSISDRAIKLEQFAPSYGPQAAAGPPGVCTELDRVGIAVVLQAFYEWGGYRYSNASGAIAAAKRGAK